MFCSVFIVMMILKFFTYSIPFPTPAIAGLGVIGFVLGTISMIKNKDRSLLTLLSVILGLVVVLWIAAEILFPH